MLENNKNNYNNIYDKKYILMVIGILILGVFFSQERCAQVYTCPEVIVPFVIGFSIIIVSLIKDNIFYRGIICRVIGAFLIFFSVTVVILHYSFNVDAVTGNNTFCLVIFSLLFILCNLAIWIYAYRGYRNKKIDINDIVFLILFESTVVKLVYVVFSSIYMRQNDVLTFYHAGHLGYINIILNDHQFPTDTSGWEYVQPPLWHLLAALWMKINMLLGKSIDMAAENIQYVSLVISVITMLVVDKIVKRLEVSNVYRVVTNIIVGFYPYLIVISGAINNDPLVVLLEMLIVYYMLCWIDEPDYANIFKLSLSFGFALMTKLSAAMLAPAITIVFVYVFFAKDNYFTRSGMNRMQTGLVLFKQYCVFTVPAAIVGLWWPIRLKLLYNLPFGYVNANGSDDIQYLGNYSLGARLFGLKNQLNHYYVCMKNTEELCDYNINIALIKYGTFGQDNFTKYNSFFAVINPVLFWVNVILTVACLSCFIVWILKEKNGISKWYIIALVVTMVLSIYYRATSKTDAFVCNMELRFILPAMLTVIAYAMRGICLITEEKTDTDNKKMVLDIKKAIFILVIVFSVLSSILWLSCMTISNYDAIKFSIF